MINLKSIIIYLKAFLAFFVIGPFLLLVIIIYPKSIYKLVVPFCQFMVYIFGCKIKVRGKFPNNESFVIMANHASFLDVFAIPSIFKGKFSAVAASFNFKIPIYASFLKFLKIVPINRSNREQAIAGIKQAERVLKDGYHIVVLPEGTRTLTGALGKFKKGGFHLAKNTNAKILPVITEGLFEFKPKNRWTLKPGIINITISEPINIDGKSVNELLQETESFFIKHLN